MRSSRRRRRSRWVLVLTAAVVLGILGYALVAGRLPLPMFSLGGIAPTDSPSGLNPPADTPAGTPLFTPKSPPDITQQPTLSVTLIGPASSADAWANALLDRVLATLRTPARPGDGFAWWQGSEAIDFLTYSGGVQFKRAPLSLKDQTSITLSIVTQSDPNQLQRVGGIQVESSALLLGVTASRPDQGDMQWILTGSAPDTALSALVVQAAARSMVLRVAYNPGSAQDSGALVLLGAQAISGTPSPSIQTPVGQTPTPQPALPSPTATHSPEQTLGTMIETRLKPVIDAGLSFPPDVVAAYTAGHAWNGPLTWNETGPKVGDRPVNVNQASELTFQILTPNDPRGPAQPFLVTDYTGNVTRFPDEQTYFTGQRMNEILYWMVTYGARRGGLLQVSYDDFGTRQAITFIGFVPFARTGSQTPGP